MPGDVVRLRLGDGVYSGSAVKQGEMTGIVTGTGTNTFFGRAASVVESAGAVSHFQKAVLAVGDFLIYLSLGLVAVLIVVQLFRGTPILETVQFALILTVAADYTWLDPKPVRWEMRRVLTLSSVLGRSLHHH